MAPSTIQVILSAVNVLPHMLLLMYYSIQSSQPWPPCHHAKSSSVIVCPAAWRHPGSNNIMASLVFLRAPATGPPVPRPPLARRPLYIKTPSAHTALGTLQPIQSPRPTAHRGVSLVSELSLLVSYLPANVLLPSACCSEFHPCPDRQPLLEPSHQTRKAA